MKILMLNHEFPPVGGGASPVTFDLCKSLATLGHHIDVVTMRFGELPHYEETAGFRVYRTPAMRKRPNISHAYELATYAPGAMVTTLKLVRQNKYDIIHSHFVVPGAMLAATLSKIAKIPYIITSHGSDVPGHNPDRFLAIHKLIKPVWSALVSRAGTIVSPSVHLANLIRQNCPSARTEVIPNGIDLKPYHSDTKQKTILMCGRLLKFKGFQYALEAIRDLAIDWPVHIIGDGPYAEHLKELAKAVKAPVTFHGWLDKDRNFYDIFAQASIFILPSEAENFPTVLLEAMASGCVIITSKTGGCPEVVGEAGVLVDPKNHMEIKDKLASITSDTQLLSDMGQRSLLRVQCFAWPGIASRYTDLYQRVTREYAFNHPSGSR
jgi:glycosyltransferase involved in cell wall biosynthesis